MKSGKAIIVGVILVILPFVFFDYSSPFYLRVVSVCVCAIGGTFLLYGLENLSKKNNIMEKLNLKNLKIEDLPKGMVIDFENSIIVMKKAVKTWEDVEDKENGIKWNSKVLFASETLKERAVASAIIGQILASGYYPVQKDRTKEGWTIITGGNEIFVSKNTQNWGNEQMHFMTEDSAREFLENNREVVKKYLIGSEN